MLTLSQIGAFLSLLIAFNVPVGTVKEVEGILMAPHRVQVQQIVVTPQDQLPASIPSVQIPTGGSVDVIDEPVFEYQAPKVTDVSGLTFKLHGENASNITITKMIVQTNASTRIDIKGGGSTFSGAFTPNLIGHLTVAKESVVPLTVSVGDLTTGNYSIKITQIHGFYSDGSEFTSVVGLPVEVVFQVP